MIELFLQDFVMIWPNSVGSSQFARQTMSPKAAKAAQFQPELNPVPIVFLIVHPQAGYCSYSRINQSPSLGMHVPTSPNYIQLNRFGKSESPIFTNTRSAAAESAESISAVDDLEDGVTMKCWN